jgi:NDP-4-keto-2,6-dideoxyhexose 3-C-methyltransferase
METKEDMSNEVIDHSQSLRYKKISQCRICGNSNLICVVDLGEQSLTGIFPKSQNNKLTSGPLRLVKCHGSPDVCGLLQLEHSFDLDEMYGDNYGYRSGLNPSMVEHLKGKVTSILRQTSLSDGDLVIDIGCNDGTTLGFFPKSLRLVGIDPTSKKFAAYIPNNIDLITEFFSKHLVHQRYQQKAKVITSFSMFYDLEDPIHFARQISEVLDDDGIWVFEQSYMPAMLEKIAYDTICHEHLEFYGLKQVQWLLDKAGLIAVDVELNEVNGGSFSVTAMHKHSALANPSLRILDLLHQEDLKRLDQLEPYLEFEKKIQISRSELKDFVENANMQGKTIFGIGASTKGNVLLQYCNFTAQDISKIGDVNPDKFGAFTPGTRIPIESEESVLKQHPDYLLVLPWHFKNFFLDNPIFKGSTLVFPLPKLEVIKR